MRNKKGNLLGVIRLEVLAELAHRPVSLPPRGIAHAPLGMQHPHAGMQRAGGQLYNQNVLRGR